MKLALSILLFMVSPVIQRSSSGQAIDSLSNQQENSAVKTDGADSESKEWYQHPAIPWIASLSISFATIIVNLWISYSQRRTSLSVVTKQIESSIKLARAQFDFTLSSKNRQDWINELRNCISEFATHVRQINIVFQRRELSDKAFAIHEKIFLYRSKIKLLLNNTKEEHKAFHQAQEDLMNTLELHLLNSNANIDQFNNVEFSLKLSAMIEKGRDLLYHEWEKVQKAQSDAPPESAE